MQLLSASPRSKGRSVCFRSVLPEGIEGGGQIVCLIVTSLWLSSPASPGLEGKELEGGLELKESSRPRMGQAGHILSLFSLYVFQIKKATLTGSSH